MAGSSNQYMQLLGTGSYLPEKVVTNDDLAEFVDTSDEWIRQRVGIRSRHYASENETTTYMAKASADRALKASGVLALDVDLIIVATTTSEYTMPSIAAMLQSELGIPSCPAFDVSAACSGFVYAVHIAKQFMENGACQNALIVASERLSRIMNWQDRSTCVLFGDGAGAAIFSASDKPGVLASSLHNDGRWHWLLYARSNLPDQLYQEQITNSYLIMDGNKVFKHAVTALSSVVQKLLDEADIKATDINWLVPHQANHRILDASANKLNLTKDKIIVTLDHQGNTSAASVPLALDHGIRNGDINRGDYLLLEAFGSGFVWGGQIILY